MNPAYRDTANGDFTLPANSPLRTCGTDGGPIGDPRWAVTDPTKVGMQQKVGPADFHLSQNYPNPFNPATKVAYAVPHQSNVKLEVFDILGRKIATLVDQTMQAGEYTTEFSATSLVSGIYVYRLFTSESTISKKMLFVK